VLRKAGKVWLQVPPTAFNKNNLQIKVGIMQAFPISAKELMDAFSKSVSLAFTQ